MNKNLKYLYLLLILFLLVIVAGLLLNSSTGINIDPLDLFNITISFAIVSLISMIVFFRGLARQPGEQVMHTITAVGIKFIAELFIALVWFVVAKKTTIECSILFLLLYLAFTLYLIWVILDTLKNKSL